MIWNHFLNHSPVSQGLIDKTIQTSREFFSLPAHTKEPWPCFRTPKQLKLSKLCWFSDLFALLTHNTAILKLVSGDFASAMFNQHGKCWLRNDTRSQADIHPVPMVPLHHPKESSTRLSKGMIKARFHESNGQQADTGHWHHIRRKHSERMAVHQEHVHRDWLEWALLCIGWRCRVSDVFQDLGPSKTVKSFRIEREREFSYVFLNLGFCNAKEQRTCYTACLRPWVLQLNI